MIRSALLGAENWLDHGFGTRHDGHWTEPDRTATLRQVHSTELHVACRPGVLGDGDALATSEPSVWLSIRTADCVPVLLAHPGLHVVAAVHAGWRGAALGILAAAARRLAAEWGCPADELLAAVGPAIGPCCYEVGEEVADRFPAHRLNRNPRPHLDLPAAVAAQLLEAGVRQARLDLLSACTACDPSRFHSFRRDGGKERMVSAIRILPA
jgi:polyphenol oxidase